MVLTCCGGGRRVVCPILGSLSLFSEHGHQKFYYVQRISRARTSPPFRLLPVFWIGYFQHDTR